MTENMKFWIGIAIGTVNGMATATVFMHVVFSILVPEYR